MHSPLRVEEQETDKNRSMQEVTGKCRHLCISTTKGIYGEKVSHSILVILNTT